MSLPEIFVGVFLGFFMGGYNWKMLANSFVATCCLVGVDRGCVPLMSATVAGTEGLWSPWCRCRMCCALPLAVWPHVPYVCLHHSTRRSLYAGYAVHCIPTAVPSCPTGSERAELPQLQQQGVSRLLTLRFWAPWSKMEDGEKAMQEGGCLRPYAVIACVRN